MKFPILEDLNSEQSKPPTETTVKAPVEKPEPEKKIPFEKTQRDH